MHTRMAFGTTGIDLHLPDGPHYRVIHARSAPPLPDTNLAIAAALDAPISGPSLSALAQGKRSAAIAICDITRPVPNSVTLPHILSRLHRAGITRENIALCIATGLHRAATPTELDIILGPEIAATYPIVNHDARDTAHRHIGTTTRGTPAIVNQRFLSADLHITLGFIEQHLMLGFSGGRKLIAPGLAGQDTIKTIHSPRFMREALATEGSIDANPLHDELLQIARMARHDFMLDVTLTQDRQISGVFAGEPVQAHAAGVHSLRADSTEYLPQLVDAAITTAAGHPLDLTFYQTIKGLTAVQHIVKPGGKILILSACTEGVGSPEFTAKLATYTTPQQFLDSIRDTPVIPDQWQLEKLALVHSHHPLLFYTPGVSPTQLGSLAAGTLPTADAAIQSLLAHLPANAEIAIVPDGPYAFARVRD